MFSLEIETLQAIHTLYFATEQELKEFVEDASLMPGIESYRSASGDPVWR